MSDLSHYQLAVDQAEAYLSGYITRPLSDEAIRWMVRGLLSGRPIAPEKLIAELHAAGYSNEKIGLLLPQHGAAKPRSEATVRSWAMRKAEPRISDYDALKALHAAAIGISCA